MPDAPIAVDLDQALDVLAYLSTEFALDSAGAIDDLTDACDLLVGEILCLGASVHSRLLADAANGKEGETSFSFTNKDEASLLVATGGSLLTIDELRQVLLEHSYVVAKTARSEVYMLDLGSILGLKLRHEKKDGAGFLG